MVVSNRGAEKKRWQKWLTTVGWFAGFAAAAAAGPAAVAGVYFLTRKANKRPTAASARSSVLGTVAVPSLVPSTYSHTHIHSTREQAVAREDVSNTTTNNKTLQVQLQHSPNCGDLPRLACRSRWWLVVVSIKGGQKIALA